jgi:hypothetical protein
MAGIKYKNDGRSSGLLMRLLLCAWRTCWEGFALCGAAMHGYPVDEELRQITDQPIRRNEH